MINTVYQQEPSPTKLARQGSNLPVFENDLWNSLVFYATFFTFSHERDRDRRGRGSQGDVGLEGMANHLDSEKISLVGSDIKWVLPGVPWTTSWSSFNSFFLSISVSKFIFTSKVTHPLFFWLVLMVYFSPNSGKRNLQRNYFNRSSNFAFELL